MAHVAGLKGQIAPTERKRLDKIIEDAGFMPYKRFPHTDKGRKDAQRYAEDVEQATGVPMTTWYTEAVGIKVL